MTPTLLDSLSDLPDKVFLGYSGYTDERAASAYKLQTGYVAHTHRAYRFNGVVFIEAPDSWQRDVRITGESPEDLVVGT